MSYDWSQFSQNIKIKASVEQLYNLWTTRHGIESWFLRMAIFTRNGKELEPNETLIKGDKYHWRWHGYPDSIEEFGEILEANGKDRLQFVFGKAGIVTVKFEQEDSTTTKMTIKQTNIPTDDESRANYHVGCSTGWTFYRCNLKSIIEGGIDIRNKDNDNDMND